MLETVGEYVVAWSIYLLAAIVAQILVWRMTRGLPLADLRTVLCLTVFAILFTPAQLDSGVNYWVPAFMAALMEGLNEGPDAALSRVGPILVVMLALVLSSFVVKFIKSKPA